MISKIIEKVIHDQTQEFLDANKILYKFRALILIEQGENQFTYSSPLKISRWLNIARVYPEVHLTSISGGRYLVGKNDENIFREIQKKQLEYEDFMLTKNISPDVSLDYVEVEDIVDRKVDQLSHQYLYQVKLKGEIGLVWYLTILSTQFS